MVCVKPEHMAALEACYLKNPPTELDGFNTRKGSRRLWYGYSSLRINQCDKDGNCPAIVTLYAKLGLHRYNLLNGTNLELIRIKRYNYFRPSAVSKYYITMLAKLPSDTSKKLIFQTRVDEGRYRAICFGVSFAQPRKSRSDPIERSCGDFVNTDDLTQWLPHNPFSQFKLLNDLELQCNDDWIRLYLELSVATAHNLSDEDHDLSDLKILKVAIDATDAKNATVYIHYEDPCEARVGKDVDRVAVVRRNYDEQTGFFSLQGQEQSSQGINFVTPQKEKGKSPAGVIVMPEEEKGQCSSDILMPEEKKGQKQRRCASPLLIACTREVDQLSMVD